MHQAVVGLHQEEQPPGPGEQAVLHTRQEDGQGIHNDLKYASVDHRSQ